MGKQGPCYHCGVTSTPLWRNGPPGKPVLCNACGSRWRTKGTLSNYIPLHARSEGDEHEDQRVSPVKTTSLKKRDEKLNKRKLSYESPVVRRYASSYNQGLQISIDEDTSNRSSSGSAVSKSESCAQFSADASDLTGPTQSTVWETQVPSKKRTCISRTNPSSVEKLTQDLQAILHEQQSSNLSGSSEEELLFESDTPMVSVEIGHGSVLIKHPSSLLREEESEASSLSVENKLSAFNESYSHSAPLFRCTDFKGETVRYHRSENHKSQMMQQQQTKRDMSIHDRMQLLWNHNSPLCHIDLNDVINFEVLLGHLTSDEQQQLLKHLPSSDTTQLPGSLSSMFDSSLFKENLSSFQQLLSEGVFSSSSLGIETEDIKTLKKLAVTNLAKSKWLELYNKLKGSKFVHDAGKHQVASGDKLGLLKKLGSAQRSPVELNQNLIGPRTTIKIPKSVLVKAGPVAKDKENSNDLSFRPSSRFPLPTEDQCVMLESHQFVDECTDQDLLLDVPSNGFFPQAELLPVSSFIRSYQISAKSSSMNPP